jgi:non-ribosomal peptide synthase protein (TIGR01720 family)
VVSWHILGQELGELLAGGGAEPVPTASVLRWAASLRAHAGLVSGEFPLWEAALSGPEARLAPGRTAAAGARATVTVVLPAERAGPALTRLPADVRCGVQEILLTALLAAAVRWRGQGTGLLVDLEGHGRQPVADDIDVSRTVGWFTAQYPVRLDAGSAGAGEFWAGGAPARQALRRVRELLGAVPLGGVGFGLLRYLNPDTGPKLAELPGPDVRFNYLGRVAGPTAAVAGMELLGAVPPDAIPLTHLVELDAVTEVGPDGPRLHATWSYPSGSLTDDEVRALAELWFAALDVLAGLVARDASGGSGGADFPLVDLTPEQLAALATELDDQDEAEQW